MALTDAFLPEFDQEMATTRKLLERVPDAKLSWKPHEKSGSMGWLGVLRWPGGFPPGWMVLFPLVRRGCWPW